MSLALRKKLDPIHINTPKVWPWVVVGGGIVGASCALALRQRGFKVLLVDPLEETKRASFGNAGVVSCGSILPVASVGVRNSLMRYALGLDPGLRLRYLSLPFISPWLRAFLQRCNAADQLATATALQALTRGAWSAHQRLAGVLHSHELLQYKGWIRLYASTDAWQAASAERALLRQFGVGLTDLNQSELREAEPALAPRFTHGSLIDDAGAVRNPEDLLRRLYEHFTQSGGVVARGQVKKIDQVQQPFVLRTDDMQICAQRIVIAAGAWSGHLLKQFKLSIPFAAERGYHQQFQLHSQSPPLQRPVYDCANGVVLSPMGYDGRDIRVLSGIELGLPNSSPSFGMLNRAIKSARQSIALELEPSREPWLGSRPSTPDGLPIIGALPNNSNILTAFGHGHIGLSTGPITGELIASLATNERPAIDLRAFNINRFF
jgi:D-amino-acid dehydrogenase